MALAANVILVGLSLILGLRLLRQYMVRSRAHTLFYALGLLLTAVAAFPEVFHKAAGWLSTGLWWLYWMTASTLVGLLGVGTAYLMSPRLGKVTLGIVGVLTLWVVVATVLTVGPAPLAMTEEAFHKAPTAAAKLPFVLQNILGSLIILVGAAISYIKTRAFYNVLIALGTLIFASGGASAGLLHIPGIFYFTQAAGIVVLYLGVSLSVAPRPAKSAAS